MVLLLDKLHNSSCNDDSWACAHARTHFLVDHESVRDSDDRHVEHEEIKQFDFLFGDKGCCLF